MPWRPGPPRPLAAAAAWALGGAVGCRAGRPGLPQAGLAPPEPPQRAALLRAAPPAGLAGGAEGRRALAAAEVRASARPDEDLTPEQLHQLRVARAVCADQSEETCTEARPPKNWRCTWSKSGEGENDGGGKKGACVPVDPCEWTPNPIVNENLGIMWLLSVAGAFECIVRLVNGCNFGVGSCLWCFLAFSLCTCCWCLPFCGDRCFSLYSKLRQSLSSPFAGPSESRMDLVVCDTHPGTDWRRLGSFVSEAALRSLEVQCGWWGVSTGRIRVCLRRDGLTICTEDVFGAGPAGHTRSGSVASRHFARGDELVSRALAGDELVFEYCTGAQRGSALRIQHFEANPSYEEPA